MMLTRDEKHEALRLLQETEYVAVKRAAAWPNSTVRAHEVETILKLEKIVEALQTV